MTQTKLSVVLRLRNPPVDADFGHAVCLLRQHADYEGKKNTAELTQRLNFSMLILEPLNSSNATGQAEI